MLSWTAVCTHSQYEQRVDAELDRLIVEHYLPTFAVERQYFNRTKAVVSFPLFRGYVFARLDEADLPIRNRIAVTTGVCGILHGAVTDPEMQQMRRLVQAGARPHEGLPDLTPGTRVRVRRGPLVGVEGIFQAAGARGQLLVSYQILGRVLATPMKRADLEPVDYSPSPYDCFTKAALASLSA